MTIQRLASDLGSFSDSVSVSGEGRWIYVSGQLGFSDDGTTVVSGGPYDEAVAAFRHVESVLAKTHGKLSSVIKITGYLTNLDHYPDFNRARTEMFEDKLPASAVVQVAGLLFGASVEVEAVAFIKDNTG